MKFAVLILPILFSATQTFAWKVVDCYEAALQRNLWENQAIQLCQGAKTMAPIECLDLAKSRQIEGSDRLRLCAQAKDLENLSCFDDATKNRKASSMLAAALCASINSSGTSL